MPAPVVDQNLCTGSGICIQVCPSSFEWDPSNPGKARATSGADCSTPCVQDAIDQCPGGAISC